MRQQLLGLSCKFNAVWLGKSLSRGNRKNFMNVLKHVYIKKLTIQNEG